MKILHWVNRLNTCRHVLRHSMYAILLNIQSSWLQVEASKFAAEKAQAGLRDNDAISVIHGQSQAPHAGCL